jgi:hypothetical protein
MQHADIDPSLRSGEPQPERLDDGFSPPPQPAHPPAEAGGLPPESALSVKSQF